jgi:hypothetical protein
MMIHATPVNLTVIIHNFANNSRNVSAVRVITSIGSPIRREIRATWRRAACALLNPPSDIVGRQVRMRHIVTCIYDTDFYVLLGVLVPQRADIEHLDAPRELRYGFCLLLDVSAKKLSFLNISLGIFR